MNPYAIAIFIMIVFTGLAFLASLADFIDKRG